MFDSDQFCTDLFLNPNQKTYSSEKPKFKKFILLFNRYQTGDLALDLRTVDRSTLDYLQAVDLDGEEFGDITFSFDPNLPDADYFEIVKYDKTRSQLKLIKAVDKDAILEVYIF